MADDGEVEINEENVAEPDRAPSPPPKLDESVSLNNCSSGRVF